MNSMFILLSKQSHFSTLMLRKGIKNLFQRGRLCLKIFDLKILTYFLKVPGQKTDRLALKILQFESD